MFNKIPADIFNSHIMPFAYNTQSVELRNDIHSYWNVKEALHEHSQDELNEKIVLFIHHCYDIYRMNNCLMQQIWRRNYMIDMFSAMQSSRARKVFMCMLDFKFVYGLMTPDERIEFMEYVKREPENEDDYEELEHDDDYDY